ncbi:transcription factor TFIIIB component B'' [Drosophila mojavensis]|uniref:transcription factor TFIIIB component B'' n=1 Tax=Drosophila mojavensis TaxID=7230 RepID=UPI0013EECC0B|nr:transcription factor TFIIIB component B'' [Drosophila mojavensis]
MSSRRQRIKATANLTQIKRKPRKEDIDSEARVEAEPLNHPVPSPKGEHPEDDAAEVAFKMPAASNAGQLDDVFHSDLEDNVIQMDLQKSASGFPMSPSKAQARQRVRPTPVFGQRRNSFVGSPLAADLDGDYPSPGTPTRRERYLSGSSMSGVSGTPQPVQASPKYFPGGIMSPGMGRIRTESSCSAYSDSGGGGGKQRKGESDKALTQSQQRINVKRDFETRFNKGIPDKSTFKMFDMIFYNPESNPMEQKPLVTTIKAEANGSSIGSVDESKPSSDELLEAKTEPYTTTAAMPVPQLKLDANGEMIIDEKTLEIETTAEVEARKVLANSSLILMDETTGDNGFYKRHKRTPTWTPDDTIRFYRSLQIIGTDFSLMCQMFPKRTRRDLKLKYKREERVNGQLINKALLYPKAFNIQELKNQLELEDRERYEVHREWQQIVSAKAKQPRKKRAKSQQSKATRALSDGDLVYENEHVTKEKLGKHALAKRRAALQNQGEGGAVKRKRQPLTCHQPQGEHQEKQQMEKQLEKLQEIIQQQQQEKLPQQQKEKPQQQQQEKLPPQQQQQKKPQQQEHEQQHSVKKKLKQKVLKKRQPNPKRPEEYVSEVDQPVPVHILRVFPAIKKEKEMEAEQISSDPIIETKAEQLQQELNSLLDEGHAEVRVKITSEKVEKVVDLEEGSRNCVSNMDTVTRSETIYSTETDATYIVDFISEPPAPEVVEQGPRFGEEVNEHDIEQIITELSEGSMVLVSSLDAGQDGRVLNEIYMYDSQTGDLSEQPLKIPEHIVQCILNVMR